MITLAACSSPAATGTAAPAPTAATPSTASQPATTQAPEPTDSARPDVTSVLFAAGEAVAGLTVEAPTMVAIDEAGADRAADLTERGFVAAARQVIPLPGGERLQASVWQFDNPTGAMAEYDATLSATPDCTDLEAAAASVATATGGTAAAWSCPSFQIGAATAPAEAIVQLVLDDTVIRVAHQGAGSLSPGAAAVLVTVATALAERAGG